MQLQQKQKWGTGSANACANTMLRTSLGQRRVQCHQQRSKGSRTHLQHWTGLLQCMEDCAENRVCPHVSPHKDLQRTEAGAASSLHIATVKRVTIGAGTRRNLKGCKLYETSCRSFDSTQTDGLTSLRRQRAACCNAEGLNLGLWCCDPLSM
jgi:hypothetical protein